MLDQVLPQLTLTNLIVNLIYTLVISVCVRFVLKVFKKVPEGHGYWFAVPALTFTVIVLLGQFTHPVASLPNLRFQIQSRYAEAETVETSPRKQLSIASMVVEIANTGEPTSLSGFGLVIELPNQPTPVIGDRMTIPMSGYGLPVGSQVEWLCGADALDLKTIDPIPRGGRRIGRVLFQFPNITTATLLSGKATFLALDSWGKAWSVPLTNNTGTVVEVRNVPGFHANATQGLPQPQGEQNNPIAANKPTTSQCAP